MADNKNYLDEGGVKALWSVMNREFPRLDESDKVPSRYLPSYVDDVVEIEDRLKIIGVDDTDYSEEAMQGELIDFLDTISSSTYSKREGDDVMGVYYINYYGLFVLKVISEEDGVSSETHYFSWEAITEGEGDNAVVIYPDSSDYGVVKSVTITNGSVSITQGITASGWYFYNKIDTQDYYAVDTDEIMFKYVFESGKIYLNKSLNKTYRWSGSQLVEVGGGVALGETSETAFRGDHGAWIYNSIMQGNPTLVSPVITISWTYYKYDGTTSATPEKNDGTASAPKIEVGYKAKYTGTFKWTAASGKKNPTSTSGTFGTTLPASGVASASKTATVSASTTLSQKLVAPKQGLIVSNGAVTAPTGSDETSASVAITFLYKRYIGVTTASSITESVIKGLSSSELTSSKSKTITGVTASGTQYYVIAYPTALGALSSIIQDGATPVLSAFTRTTVSVTNAAGYTQDYYVYRSNNVGAFTNAKLALS